MSIDRARLKGNSSHFVPTLWFITRDKIVLLLRCMIVEAVKARIKLRRNEFSILLEQMSINQETNGVSYSKKPGGVQTKPRTFDEVAGEFILRVRSDFVARTI